MQPPAPAAQQGQRLRLEFIDPLFAIAVHIGVVEGIMKSPWFEATRNPTSKDEWFNIAVFGLGFLLLVLSWFGYHASLLRRPLRGGGRFVIDVVLVLLYAAILVKYDHFSAVLFLLMIVFLLYPVWDVFKIVEHPVTSRESGYRREAVSALFALGFIALYVADYRSWLPPGVLLSFAFFGVVAYRAVKAHGIASLLGIVGPSGSTTDSND
jgi:uncharacterized membrane protein